VDSVAWFVLTFRRKKSVVQPESQTGMLKDRVVLLLKDMPLAKSEISSRLGQKRVSGQLNNVIRVLLAENLIELTMPDKPNSRLQKYRLTKKGAKAAGK